MTSASPTGTPAAMAPGSAEITVEVVHAETERAISKSYRLGAPATVADAVRLAAADSGFSAIDFSTAAIGIYGKAVPLGHPLEEGDRVEIYRQLANDPKTARRVRVERARRQAR